MTAPAERAASVVVLVLAGCGATGLPAPGTPDARRAQTRWPGTELAQLERGRALYRAHCSSCHQPVAPSAHPADEWPGLLQEMAARSNLEGEELSLVERYVVTMAEAGR